MVPRLVFGGASMKQNNLIRLSLTIVIAFVFPFSVGAQNSTTAPILKITGEGTKSLNLSASDLVKLPHTLVTAKANDGTEAKYEGILLSDVLKLAGVKFGEGLRGKDLALFLVVDAVDGYRAVFALPELDAAFNDKLFVLADKRNGEPLAAKDGPLQIVIPTEKRHARWVRQVVSLTIRRAD
jgi:hypothetical protein